MRSLWCCLLLFLLVLPGWAQDQEELLRSYRGPWNGYAIHTELFKRYVKINATPDWWAYLCANRDAGYNLVNISNGILDLAPGLGWADVKTLDNEMGSNGDAPPVLEALDSWKGKLQVTINLPGGLDDVRKKQFIDNYMMISGVIGYKHDCLPRGGKFFLTIGVQPKATTVTGTVSKDGNTYDLLLPVYTGVSSAPFEPIFQKGMK